MAIYTPYPFTNISKNIWVGRHDNEDYIFQPGETKYLPSFLVSGFVNHFINWAINSEEFGIKKEDGTFDKPKFLTDKRSEMESKLRNENYKIVPNTVLPKEGGAYKCDICGKTFKNQGGLNLHKTSHKTKVETPVQS